MLFYGPDLYLAELNICGRNDLNKQAQGRFVHLGCWVCVFCWPVEISLTACLAQPPFASTLNSMCVYFGFVSPRCWNLPSFLTRLCIYPHMCRQVTVPKRKHKSDKPKSPESGCSSPEPDHQDSSGSEREPHTLKLTSKYAHTQAEQSI